MSPTSNKKILPNTARSHTQSQAQRGLFYMNDFAGITVPRLKNLLFVPHYTSGGGILQALFHSLDTICRFP